MIRAGVVAPVRLSAGEREALRFLPRQTLAERLAVAAPTTRRLWTLAADQALAVGDADWAVALGQIALATAAATPAAHAHLARLHAAAGNTEAQSRRAETASRLSATTNRRKG